MVEEMWQLVCEFSPHIEPVVRFMGAVQASDGGVELFDVMEFGLVVGFEN